MSILRFRVVTVQMCECKQRLDPNNGPTMHDRRIQFVFNYNFIVLFSTTPLQLFEVRTAISEASAQVLGSTHSSLCSRSFFCISTKLGLVALTKHVECSADVRIAYWKAPARPP